MKWPAFDWSKQSKPPHKLIKVKQSGNSFSLLPHIHEKNSNFIELQLVLNTFLYHHYSRTAENNAQPRVDRPYKRRRLLEGIDIFLLSSVLLDGATKFVQQLYLNS